MDLSDYSFPNQTPTWCPGCGNFAVLSAVKKSLSELSISPKDIVVTYDIGCGGNMVNNLAVCGFATLHGRSIPVAVGAKMANPDLTVIAQGGDGGLLNEGANHLIHAAQRNDNITVLLHNNQIFALTAGQASSATPKNMATKSTPSGLVYSPLNPLLLAAASGAGFLARAYPFDLEKTIKIIKQAISYQGFSLVEIVMPCLIWGKEKADGLISQFFYPDSLPQDYQQALDFLAKEKNSLALGVIWRK
ncbi:MAG: Pyruvate ferredoxin/flavodoxin oxidoreductase, beta subunit [Microgenomates bacterium 39_6]|nr:MAG: Pyruvate ferredoxin/flavodoxin oxidoreductase, beta subunit [Microgenomates bacterium 39_6]